MARRRAAVAVRWARMGVLGLSLTAGCADRTPGGSRPGAAADLHLLRVGDRTLHVELATTAETRRRGLMFRRSLPPDRGMLFIFKEAEFQSFWMKNTYVPLDVAFVDDARRIFQIERMEPLSEAGHESTRPARYVLEVPAGWFAENEVGPGATLGLSESIRRKPVE